MERLFQTHEIRKQEELSGLWDFYPLEKPQEKKKVFVPGCVESCPGLENYRGTSVYEREVFLQGNVRLCLKGVSHTAKVYLDGVPVGEHYNAYTPFTILLRDVPEGKHVIQVTADNSCHQDSALHVINDYYNYGGITRPVFVESVGEVYKKEENR